ncbi:replicative DNA helicase [Adlercreutzia caecimuris]|jgi:replicative DNA helicase|uniref:Replicative DNA helicase n=1 Tax=Adlercreutzia caecimuris B7 TaxID=1235794 RepID=R9L3L2_9ACTN|nr:replicative DNA helicase [Adlercreutzia caecimuris]EOS50317.1 replicative DNA helicase [Adlercreutzia caecimuris B7]MCI9208364.1 replicative DNA helicase [Adlercreutzia caecimuris]MCR2036938.1 replicative DNA helicase [Adlercreutzia caecimuris]
MPFPSPDQSHPEPAPLAPQAQLPQNIEAEQSVLAACLLNHEVTEEAVMRIKPENFFRPAHRIIFEAIQGLVNRRIPVDPISLADTLKAQGQLDAVGGRAYLAELADNTFSLTSWERHVDIVKRQAILRELVYASAQINALAYDAPDDVNEVVEEAEKMLLNVTEKRVSSTFRKMDELVNEAYEQITILANQKNHMVGVPTGFKDVDDLIHGFRGGDLVILAARPGVGKTSFALNLATNAAKAGVAVTFFSLEMGAEQLVQRILCSEARVSLSKLRSGLIAEGDWGALAEHSGKLSQLDFYIDDAPGLTILEARAKARRELHGIKEGQKGLIVVDYLQLMQPSPGTKNKSTNDQVGEISRGLKILAKEMNMPVIALSQLSRAVEQRGKDKRPMLSDLRDSGSIEQDADIVMFIDRSMNEIEAESESRPDLGMAKLIVAKHRNGATRDIDLAFNPEFTKFMDFIDDSRVGSF